MKKKFTLFLCLCCMGIGTLFADAEKASEWSPTKAYTAKMEAVPQSVRTDSPAKAQFKHGSLPESASALTFSSKRKEQRAASIADYEGNRMLMAHRTTGLLAGETLTIVKVGDDSIAMSGFIYSDVTVKAKIDLAAGTITIPCQHVADISTGAISLCKMDFRNSVYSTTDAITGTIEGGDIHIEDGFGFFVTSGAQTGAYLTVGLMEYADAAVANATLTNNVISFTDNTLTTANRKVTAESDWAYVYQMSDDKVRISHLSTTSGYCDIVATLNYDKTLSIDPQMMFTATYSGAFNAYKMSETVSSGTVSISAQILSPISATFADSKIVWGKWMIGSTSASSFAGLFESTSVATTASLVFPEKPETAWEGDGTAASPYLIKTMSDLNALAVSVNTDATVRGAAQTDVESASFYPAYAGKYFKLAADLDYATYKSAIVPIGNSAVRFAGIFDGDNHTIANLQYVDYAYDYCGLFGCLATGSEVKNIKFTNPYIKSMGYIVGVVAGRNFGTIDACSTTGAKIYATAGYNAGGIAGSNYGTISNSETLGEYITALGYIGGINGRSYGAITGCKATGRLYMTGSQNFAGGIVGYSSRKGSTGDLVKLTDCSFVGTISTPSNEISLGGIAGMIANVEMSGCFAVPYLVNASSTAAMLGGLAGAIWQVNIHDCFAGGVINNPESAYTGGLIGHNSEIDSGTGAIIKNCYSSAYVLTKSTDALAGIIGGGNYHTTITDCYYDAQIAGIANAEIGLKTSSMTTAAGLPGFSADAWAFTEGLYPQLKSNMDGDAAAVAAAPLTLAGDETVAMVKNNFKYSTANEVVWKSVVNSQYSETGGYAFTFNNGEGVLNYRQYTDTIYATKNGVSKFYFVNIAPMPFNGEGTAASPWEIGTKVELKQFADIANNASLDFAGNCFKMVADIDMEGETVTPVCKDATAKFAFQGTFDGNGHTIDNIAVSTVEYYDTGIVNPKSDNSYNYGGLFANVGVDGIIKNLTMGKGCKFDLFSYGAAIAGSCAGTIANCKNYAPVTVYFAKAGGIVGDLKAGGVVKGCYNEGVIRVGYYSAGGIVGTSTSATVENCANAGNVGALFINDYQAATKQYSAGGIVGENAKGDILNVLNTGTVSSYKKVGGIVGTQTATTAAPATIANAVNYGSVITLNETSSIGQIVGDNTLGELTNCYLDAQMQKVGAVNNAADKGANAMKTMTLASASVALPDSVWTCAANSYPVLAVAADNKQIKLDSHAIVALDESDFASCVTKPATLVNTQAVAYVLKKGTAFGLSASVLSVSIPATGVETDTIVASMDGYTHLIPLASLNAKILDGEGTADNPFQIKTAADFLSLSAFVASTGYDYEGSFFKILNNLDFSGLAFEPVGYGTSRFQGVLDGNGKTVSNIAYATDATDKTAAERGLFGVIGSEGVVKNIELDATNSFATYTKCGGIVGGLYGKAVNCVNKGKVSTVGTTYAGGIAGFAYNNSSFTNCKNEGEVTSKTSYAGGIVGGSLAGAGIGVESCSNAGTIMGTIKVGGIAGSASASLSHCDNTGDVIATTNYAGGIIAEALLPSSVAYSHNEGGVCTNQYMGGIVGTSVVHTTAAPFVIDSCYNVAALEPAYTSASKGYAGGIAGQLKAGARIVNCYNTGDITSSLAQIPTLGGIVADMAGSLTGYSAIENCHNSGKLNGLNFLGGIAARFTGDSCSTVSNCYNVAEIVSTGTTSAYVGGIVGNGGYFMLDCWNSGDLTAVATYVGGLSGYMTGKMYKYERNFNVGNISVTTAKGLQVGGLVGMGRPYMLDCYNFGDVTGYNNVGGLVGYPGNAAAESFTVKLHRSYNAGKLTATGGTNVGNACANNASCSYLEVGDIYFDSSVSEETAYDKTLTGCMAKTHAEMLTLDLGDAFERATAAYPSLKSQSANLFNSFAVATVLLADGETLDNVLTRFKVGTPEGAEWTSTGKIEVKGNDVYLLDHEQGEHATLTLTVGDMSRTYDITFGAALSGVDNVSGEAKTVLSRLYYTTAGIQVSKPSTEMGVVIEKTVYADGTTATRKFIPQD